MPKQKYYTLKNILKENCEYNILLGERSNGKSYSVKHHCIEEYLSKEYCFIYLRRYTVESKNYMVESYFDDVDIKKLSKGKYTNITVYRSEIFLGHEDESGKIIRDVKCGMVMSLSVSMHYKSMSLLAYKNVIFEEFITQSVYLQDECNMLQQLISTIARRNKIRVWLIGNTISRLCPYFNEWQLFNIPKQKQGTIEIYRMKTDQKDENGENITINIAVELCENSGNNSKMFFGAISSSITNGSWEADVQPHIPYKYEDCKFLYSCSIKKHNMIYVMEVLRHEDEMFIFVHPSKKIRSLRVIDELYQPNMFTTAKLVELTSGDRVIKMLIKMNKICYSDNLTGTEFINNVLPTL